MGLIYIEKRFQESDLANSSFRGRDTPVKEIDSRFRNVGGSQR